ncbi:MAG: hypothetical protein K5984_07245 [Bacteroidales bacterium]|nr:hypothetical protein [Bacteroidales bacterium]
MLNEATEILPVDEALRSGYIVLDQAIGEPTRYSVWGSDPFMEVLIVAATIFTLLNIRNLITIFPLLIESLIHWRGCLNIESSVRTIRARDIVGASLILPFCLLCDYFDILTPSFKEGLSASLSILVTIGLFLLWLIVRILMTYIIQPSRRTRDTWTSAANSPNSFFILATLAIFIASSVMHLTGYDDYLIHKAIIIIITFFYAVSIIRKAQILGSAYGGLSIILYLCALEILPTGLLLAACTLL